MVSFIKLKGQISPFIFVISLKKKMLRFGVFDCKVECYNEPFDRLVDHRLLTL